MNGPIIAAVKKLSEQRLNLIVSLTDERARLVAATSEVDALLKDLTGPAASPPSKDEMSSVETSEAKTNGAKLKAHANGAKTNGASPVRSVAQDLKMRVVSYLRTHPDSSSADIIKATGSDSMATYHWLSHWTKNKTLKRIGERGNFRYRLPR